MMKPSEMHARAQERTRSEAVVVEDFSTYVNRRISEHSGLSENPRTICGVSTREYVVIPTRNQRERDAMEASSVATSLQLAGYYARLLDTNGVALYSHTAIMVCWDPDVIKMSSAENTLYDAKSFKLYTTVMQYVQAEKSLESIPADSKPTMTLNGVDTTEWTCISILTQAMRDEVNVVGRYLWNNGYYIALRDNNRRPGTWAMFVSWDERIVKSMGECDGTFAFDGVVPSTWN